jgi:NAD(P)-dependent dehydrogenase (short-subunit alcohol dehydrogenase family)
MNKSSDDKVALITGSTHGIGEVIALELAKNDFKIVINGASTKGLSEKYISNLKAIYGDMLKESYLYIQADISKVSERKRLLDQIKKKFDRLDVLINNAGIAPENRKDILEMTEDSYEQIMAVNLKGPFLLTQSIARWMIELKTTLNEEYQPYIINISSLSRYTTSRNRAEYCISKAGMTMMTKLFAERLADHQIPVFEISPGIINTPMTEKVHKKYDKLINEGLIPIKRWGKPIDIAKPVIAIIKGYFPYATGLVLDIDGGFHIRRL